MKSKKIVMMVIAVACIIQAASAYEDAILLIELPSQSVSPRSTFTANITVDPVDNEVHYAGYTILFDKDMMNVISQTQGNFLSQDGADTLLIETYNNTAGKAEYDETRSVDYGVTNPGILASITFNVTGNAGTGSLNFSSTMMGGNFNPYGNPINVTTYNATFTVDALKIGDVNGDGSITSADAVIALQMAVRGEYSDVADVSGDNSVTSLDALMIQRAAINSITL